MASEVIEIEVNKGGCLLCLGACPPIGNLPDSDVTSTSFKTLLRFLNFDTGKLGQLSSSFTSFIHGDGDSVNISVSLCVSCSSLTTRFLQVFHEFERIQRELEKCVENLHQTIEGEERNKDKSNNEVNMGTFTQAHCLKSASLTEAVREEILEKCAIKMTSRNRAIHKVAHGDSTTELQFHGEEELGVVDGYYNDARQVPEDVELVVVPGTAKSSSFRWIPIEEGGLPTNILQSHTPPPVISTLVENNTEPFVKCKSEQNTFPKIEVDESAYDFPAYEQDPLEMSNDPLLDTGMGEEMETQACIQRRMISERLTSQEESSPPPLNGNSCNSNSNSTLKCDFCHKSSLRHASELRIHQVKSHTFQYFSHQLPPGTTEFQLKAAIDSVLSKKVVVKRGLDKRRGILKCPCCTRTCRDDLLRPHVLDKHFERVLKTLEKNLMPPPTRKIKATEDVDEALHNRSSSTFNSNPSCTTLPGGKLQCDLCGKIFATKDNFERHIRELHSGVVFQCLHCDRSFPRQVNFRIHLATVHTTLTFADRLPPNTSDEEIREAVKSLISQSRNTKSPKKCPLCSKNCRDCFQMRSHILRSHFDEVAAVVETTRGNNKAGEEEEELSQLHDEDDFDVIGDYPEDETEEATEWKVHEEIHEIEEVDQVENMEVEHLGTVAGTWMPPGRNCKTCDICGKGFRTTAGKSQHRQSHNGVVSCVVCKATFRYEHSFIRHCKHFGHSI